MTSPVVALMKISTMGGSRGVKNVRKCPHDIPLVKPLSAVSRAGRDEKVLRFSHCSFSPLPEIQTPVALYMLDVVMC